MTASPTGLERRHVGRKPHIQFGQQMVVGVLRLYQWVVSPLLGPTCRFHPCCSDYAMEAVTRYGVFSGAWLATRRLLRCHPFGRHGCDPVP